MGKILDKHLNAVAKGVGRFLRGFDDPRMHLGSTDLFAREFRKVLEYPALRLPGVTRMVAYSEALTSCRVTQITVQGEPDTPLSVMVAGLAGSSVPSAEASQELPPDQLRQDLSALLRLPAMLFYFQVSDVGAFFTELERIAKRENFPLVIGGSKSRRAFEPCPACGANLPPGPHSRMLQCGSCRKALEIVRSLPMVSGAAAVISYEMLRKMAASDLVLSYQEEGDIRPQ